MLSAVVQPRRSALKLICPQDNLAEYQTPHGLALPILAGFVSKRPGEALREYLAGRKGNNQEPS